MNMCNLQINKVKELAELVKKRKTKRITCQ